jgi:K+-transporting ATPase ATPase A chain
MVALFAAGLVVCDLAERRGGPMAAGNMEGKEARFGIGGSVLAGVTSSNGATGSYNSMHDSYTPLGGGVLLVNMLLGEIVFGGLGTGLSSMILVALIGLFLAGLMIGRKPEFLGKEIGIPEMKLIMLYTLAGPIAVLVLSAVAVVTGPGLAGLTTNDGAHGLTEILFAYTSAFANNGQSFAGLSANSVFYNTTTALAMLMGRFALAVPALALAGHFARQGRRPAAGAVPADSFLFGVLLVGTAIIVGGLSYFPMLALGPILEHLLMHG